MTVLGLFGEMGRQSGKQHYILLEPDIKPWGMIVLLGQHNLLAQVCFQGLEEIDIANKKLHFGKRNTLLGRNIFLREQFGLSTSKVKDNQVSRDHCYV